MILASLGLEMEWKNMFLDYIFDDISENTIQKVKKNVYMNLPLQMLSRDSVHD